jgi:putative flippase GtrA
VQFFRYLLVAVAAFAVDFGTYTILVKAVNVHPVIAATAGFMLGIIVNYLLSIRWVFDKRSHSTKYELTVFTVIGLVGLGLTDLIVWLIAVEAGKDELVAKIVATAIVFFWNFGARKIILFNKEKSWQKPVSGQQ